jgi:preprotein translocase subunit SecD
MNWKIWVLIIALVSSFLFLAPWQAFEKGALISSVERNSTEFNAGLRAGMIITEINSKPVTDVQSYTKAISEIFSKVNNSNLNETIKVTINTKASTIIFRTAESPNIVVSGIPTTKLKTGLDLSGGARALIKAENKTLSDAEMSDLIAITSERFNIYGLKDITIKQVKDLSGNNYMLIEIAGASPSDLEDLISNQGKFEARIGNATVFVGGKDISHVERSGQNAGIEGCSAYQSQEVCRFRFPISLTEESATRQADITKTLPLSSENPEYLSEKLDLYVDNNLMDSLFISKDLKGRVTTEISIQGSGTGTTRQEAIVDAQNNMKKLQTILITGSLPFKLEIVKLDTISPSLGKEFTKNLIYLALVVFVIISVVLFIKYRKIKITSAVILTMFSEAVITLGIAALIKWNLDASSIAGIIAGMGTGVNDQIVLIDESVSNEHLSMKERIKRGFFIIIGAFFTIIAAMLPLFWAGAGMLKGFALTTILSVLAGILITRPAFSEILRKIQE